MPGIQAGGVGSGLDINSLVTQLVSAEGTPLQQRITRHEVAVTTKVSALGALKGALASFKAALEPLKSVEVFQARKAVSGDSKIFTVSAAASAAAGHYDVEVVHLSSAHQLSSETISGGSDAAVGHGTLTLSVGAASFQVTIDPDANTLADIRDAINTATDNKGVQATLLNSLDGARLVLTSSINGEDGAIEVAASGGDGGLAQLSYDADGVQSLTERQPARNGQIRIAGFDIESSSNVFEDAIDGVTITALAPSEGEQVNLDISFDSSSVRARIQKFVTEYNSTQAQLAKLGSYNAATKAAGPLLGDALLRAIESDTRRGLSDPVAGLSGNYTTLASIGITTTTSGTLEIDSSKLGKALEADADAVAQLFGADNGVAARLYDQLAARLADSGDISGRDSRLKDELKDIERNKEALTLRLAQIEARYRKQFTALDTLLTQMQSSSSYLSQQLANLPGSGNNRR